jgi:hypothetical protein
VILGHWFNALHAQLVDKWSFFVQLGGQGSPFAVWVCSGVGGLVAASTELASPASSTIKNSLICVGSNRKRQHINADRPAAAVDTAVQITGSPRKAQH